MDTPWMQPRSGLGDFLRESRAELHKVTWPDRRTLVTYSKVVMVAVVSLTSFVVFLDVLFSRDLHRLFGI